MKKLITTTLLLITLADCKDKSKDRSYIDTGFHLDTVNAIIIRRRIDSALRVHTHTERNMKFYWNNDADSGSRIPFYAGGTGSIKVDTLGKLTFPHSSAYPILTIPSAEKRTDIMMVIGDGGDSTGGGGSYIALKNNAADSISGGGGGTFERGHGSDSLPLKFSTSDSARNMWDSSMFIAIYLHNYVVFSKSPYNSFDSGKMYINGDTIKIIRGMAKEYFRLYQQNDSLKKLNLKIKNAF